MELSDNLKQIIEQIAEDAKMLAKGPNYWKDKNPAKYKKMLGKLKSERKRPGTKERAHQELQQAKRRERGGSGTTTGGGHSKGKFNGDYKKRRKAFQNSEKKTGTKLSPDRKDNNKGYHSSNTRLVPQKLNRGRHKVDGKKLSEWKKKVKKCNISDEQFELLIKAKLSECSDFDNEESNNQLSDIMAAFKDEQE